MRRLLLSLLSSAAIASALGCGAGTQNPRSVLSAYADALEDGRADDAYRLLADDAKRGITLEAFRQLVQQNREEAEELGKSLARPTEDPYVTAIVPLASGEVIKLVFEDGRWRVDGSALDFYSQASPRQAIVGFIRAFDRRRYDILLKYMPDGHKKGLDEKGLQAAWAEGKPEAKRIEELLEAVKQSLPTATIEETGDRATMVYGSAGTVLLVREHGAWKIETLR